MASGISPWNSPLDPILHLLGQVILIWLTCRVLFFIDDYSVLEKVFRLLGIA